MSRVRLALVGASGRMGSEIVRLLPQFSNIELVAAVVSAQSKQLAAVCHGSVIFTSDLVAALGGSDVVAEFCGADASVQVARECARQGKPLLVASTGQSAEQKEALARAAEHAALLIAPNLSIGVAVLQTLCARARAMLGPDFEAEIFELHHRGKLDAPSGTALALARSLGAESEIILNRTDRRQSRTSEEIGLASLRGGTVVGEHSGFLLGNGERLELSHRAWSREIFARGAFKALEWLNKRGPGSYEMTDVLNSHLTG